MCKKSNKIYVTRELLIFEPREVIFIIHALVYERLTYISSEMRYFF